MVTLPTAEGTIPFHIAGIYQPCHTWYKIIGTISAASKPPLILLHGGPGACHNYLLPFIDLWKNYNIPVIFYDQIGNGLSTHLAEKNGDKKFWVESLFIQELDNLIDHFDLRKYGFDIYGQSWGGMFGSAYAALKPKGLRKLIIANSPATSDLWVEGVKNLFKGMPKDIQEAFDEAEKTGDYESETYQTAVNAFYKKHMCRLEIWPEELQTSFEWLGRDPTVYGSMWGPSEVTLVGSLQGWTVVDKLKNIQVPVLVYNGEFDEAQNMCVEPFFWGLKKVKWVTVQGGSHMTHLEKRKEVIKLVGKFLVQEST